MAFWTGDDGIQVLITPTVDTGGAYAALECIGGKQTIGPTTGFKIIRSRAGTLTIVSAHLHDKASQIGTHGIRLYVFRDDPSGSTFTDQAALNIVDADLTKLVGCITFTEATGAEFASSSANEFAQRLNLNMKVEPATETIYVVFATVAGSTPTFTSTSDLSARLMIRRD